MKSPLRFRKLRKKASSSKLLEDDSTLSPVVQSRARQKRVFFANVNSTDDDDDIDVATTTMDMQSRQCHVQSFVDNNSSSSKLSSRRQVVDAPDERPSIDAPGWVQSNKVVSQNQHQVPTSEWPPQVPPTVLASNVSVASSMATRSFHSSSHLPSASDTARDNGIITSRVQQQSRVAIQDQCSVGSFSTAYDDTWSFADAHHVSNQGLAKHAHDGQQQQNEMRKDSSTAEPINDDEDDEVFQVLPKSTTSSGSMPPQGFTLPRQEIRDAIQYHDMLGKTLSNPELNPRDLIQYHDKLGKTLSQLALDPQLRSNGKGDGTAGEYSVTLTHSTDDMSSFDSSRLNGLKYSFSGSDCGGGLGAANNNSSNDVGEGIHGRTVGSLLSNQWVAKNFFDGNIRLEQVSSMDSGSSNNTGYISKAISTQSNRSSRSIQKLEQHVSFLERSASSNNHDNNVTPPINHQQRTDNNITPSNDSVSFFPEVDDLKSPPMWVSSSDGETGDEDAVVESSPPNTPMGCAASSLQEVESSDMMSKIRDQIRLNVKQTMDTEMEQHHSKLKETVSEMSTQLEKTVQDTVKRHVDKENAHPQQQSSMNESGGLLKELEKSFQSMEESILNKLTLQMDKEASYQRQAMEEIIEEKVSKVIAGSSLEMNLAVQEVKKESERVTKMNALRERTPPLGERTPPRRTKTPPRVPSTMKKRISSKSPNRRHSAPSPNSSKKSNKSDNSWIQSTSPSTKNLEDSFADTMRVIDEFVDDCDDIANDFDRIAHRMRDVDLPSDPEYDDSDIDDYEYMGVANEL